MEIKRILRARTESRHLGGGRLPAEASAKEGMDSSEVDGGKPKSLLNQAQESISESLTDVIKLIETKIEDEPPVDLKKGNLIKPAISQELDQLRDVIGGGKDWIKQMEKQEIANTKINSLKIKFNKVFGYYIEVSKSNLNLVPDHYTRKQTLVNAERFITPELKEKEELVLSAEEKIVQLEYQLFLQVVDQVLNFISEIQQTANAIGAVDCLVNFAYLAERHHYCKPEIINSGEINIEQGRHPVVEQLLEDEQFIPNNTTLNNQSEQLLIITGPNMAGKSVYIRQVAIISLMAQMGCFVPAESAKLSVVDRIFVRSGAADVIAMGLSTFMVEMMETAHILNHATKDSLIIMDEIGRGTSTYDGVSLAWSIAEYLAAKKYSSPQRSPSVDGGRGDLPRYPSPYQGEVRRGHLEKNTNNSKELSKPQRVGPKTLFATHYHELQALADQYPQIKNYQVAVEEHQGEPIFLHQVVEGGASHSYGIAVAKLAGVPQEVLQRAVEVLNSLEGRGTETPQHKMAIASAEQLSFLKDTEHPIVKQLKDLELNSLTPIGALQKLAELKEKL